MSLEAKATRMQWILLGAAIGLAGFYYIGYRALQTEALDLDRPLAAAEKALSDAIQRSPVVIGRDPAAMTASVNQMEAAAAAVQQAQRAAQSRLTIDPELATKLGEPWQLFEFENHRQQLLTTLRQLAATNKVTLEPAALAGLPNYTTNSFRPPLLWAHLDIAYQALSTALAYRPVAIKGITPLPIRTHTSRDGRDSLLLEFPLGLECTGPVDAIAGYLFSLPLGAAELSQLSAPNTLTNKRPLFIERLVVKVSPGALNQAQLDVIISGFVNLN